MTTAQDSGEDLAAHHRDRMVDQLAATPQGLPAPVEAALRTVPRHLFTPGVPVARAYEDEPIVTKRDHGAGINLSSVSAPNAIASMLALLEVRPGHHVLEIGSGGYNAALLRELVGPDGSVTSMDIDSEVIDRARACLDAAGYPEVATFCADGEHGVPEAAPFDRIIVTVGAWDIPPAWISQLNPGGRLVLPLRTRGWTHAWALDKTADGRLDSRDYRVTGFVPIQGAGTHAGSSVRIDDGVSLWLDETRDPDAVQLPEGVLSTPGHEAWSGVTVAHGEFFPTLGLSLLTQPAVVRMVAEQEAVDRGLVRPSWRLGAAALVAGDSIAYRVPLRPTAAGDRLEFGAIGHGPDGKALAEELVEHVRTWHREHHTRQPQLSVHPASATKRELPEGFVLRKRHTTLVVSWADPVR